MKEAITKFKYITIKQEGLEKFEGHPVYRVFNNKSGEQLGILSWYKPWKQYVFSSHEGCVFNHSCLSDILGFLKSLNSPEVVG